MSHKYDLSTLENLLVAGLRIGAIGCHWNSYGIGGTRTRTTPEAFPDLRRRVFAGGLPVGLANALVGRVGCR